jgi:hypothetical protein
MYAIPVPLVTVAVADLWILHTAVPKRTLHGAAAEQPAPMVNTVELVSVTPSVDKTPLPLPLPLPLLTLLGSHCAKAAFHASTCPFVAGVAATGWP